MNPILLLKAAPYLAIVLLLGGNYAQHVVWKHEIHGCAVSISRQNPVKGCGEEIDAALVARDNLEMSRIAAAAAADAKAQAVEAAKRQAVLLDDAIKIKDAPHAQEIHCATTGAFVELRKQLCDQAGGCPVARSPGSSKRVSM